MLVLDDGRVAAAGRPADVLPDLPRPRPRRPHDPGAVAPVVETRAAVRRFGSLAAVDGVDLAVRPGEVVGLLGANGAGKTTLIRMLLGLLRPTAGDVLLFGAPPSRASRRRIGYVPQGLGLWEDLTVTQNLDFTSEAFGVPGRRSTRISPPFAVTSCATCPWGCAAALPSRPPSHTRPRCWCWTSRPQASALPPGRGSGAPCTMPPTAAPRSW